MKFFSFAGVFDFNLDTPSLTEVLATRLVLRLRLVTGYEIVKLTADEEC